MHKLSFFRPLLQKTSTDWPWHLMGHLFFGIMFIMSLVLYKERMLAMDSAYYAFKVIVHEGFFTGHHRSISYLPQLFPLLGIKLGWSLKAVLMAYSAGFILFYYAAYNIIVYLFKNPQAGLFLALSLGLSMRYKFYGPVGEVVLSIVYMALLLGWLTKPKDKFSHLNMWLDVLVGIAIASLLHTAHPFITITTTISLGFVLIFQKEWRNLRFWATSIYTGVLLLFSFVLVERNAYEADRADRLSEAWEVLENYNDYYISEVIYSYFDAQYVLPFVVFLVSLILLLFSKRFFSALYLSLSFLILLGIIIVMHAYLSSKILIMLDGYMVHLGVIWALPLAFHWGRERQRWMVPTITLLLIFSLARINDSKVFFQERLAYLENALAQHTSPEHPKAVAYLEDFNYEKLWIGWALSCETTMLSSLEGPDFSRSIYLADKRGDLDGRFDEPNLYLNVPFAPDFIKNDDLPLQYFQFRKVPYREIELD
ncbi:MAG: hypothetical protein ACRBG0_02715 [Lewinella sp.]|uniref:hypothetical protein n=1 Tax=Lewinella sp. TaxID=2004506 RepID=UPI003D6B9757